MGQYTTFWALFCTAEIPSNVLNKLLRKAVAAFEDQGGEGQGHEVGEMVIIKTRDLSGFGSITEGSRPPVASFENAYVGASLEELAELHEKNLSSASRQWNSTGFVVADERTPNDESVLLCHVRDGKVEDTIRSDFTVALERMLELETGDTVFEELKGSTDSRGILTSQSMQEALERGEGA